MVAPRTLVLDCTYTVQYFHLDHWAWLIWQQRFAFSDPNAEDEVLLNWNIVLYFILPLPSIMNASNEAHNLWFGVTLFARVGNVEWTSQQCGQLYMHRSSHKQSTVAMLAMPSEGMVQLELLYSVPVLTLKGGMFVPKNV